MKVGGSMKWSGKKGVYSILPIEDTDISFRCYRIRTRTDLEPCGFEAFDTDKVEFLHRFRRMGKYFWRYDWFWTALGGVGTEHSPGRYRAPLVQSATYTCGKRVFGNVTRPSTRCRFPAGAPWIPLEPYTRGP
jgi:hypothetical protein